jgi:hypothetical protein
VHLGNSPSFGAQVMLGFDCKIVKELEVRIMAALGATPIAWAVLAVVIVLFFAAVVLSSIRGPSPRLSEHEERVDLVGMSPARMLRLRATRIPGRRGAWNALVASDDAKRLKAQLRGNRITRRFVAWSYLVVGLLATASLFSSVAIYVDATRAGSLTLSTAVQAVGLVVVFGTAWHGVPMLMLWKRQSIERARMPFAWRLLARSEAIKTLAAPVRARWIGHENPRDGRVTVETARRMLSTIEAEIIESFAKPRKPSASALLLWRAYDAPRVSRVLEAKARMLGQSGTEVKVEHIFDWVDLVVDELVNQRARRRVLDSTLIASELGHPRLLAHAKRVLWLRFWQSPASLFSPILALALGAVFVGWLFSEFQTAFEANHDDLAWMGNIVAGTITALVANVALSLFRMAARRFASDAGQSPTA